MRAGSHPLPTQIPTHQRDVRGLNRHIRSGTHGESQIGLCECRGIVHAVAYHRHNARLGGRARPTFYLCSVAALQQLDLRRLVSGQHLGHHLASSGVEPQAPGHGLGRAPVVA